MLSAVLTVTVIAWGWVPVGTGEIPPIQPPPASNAPAPEVPAPGTAAPPAPAPVSSSPGFANYPPPVIFVESLDTEVRWYGWELILTDLGSIALIANVRGPVGVTLGLGGLVLGAPTLHFVNHNYGTGAASLAVRGGVALLVAGLGNSNTHPCPMNDPGCPAERFGDEIIGAGVALGLLLGAFAYVIVDDTVLARRTVVRRRAVQLSPMVAPQSGGVSLGLGGSF